MSAVRALDDGDEIMMKMLSALAFAGLIWFLIRVLPPTAATMTGAAVLVGAVVLLIWTRVQLGDAFTVRAKPKGLVTGGPYSRIRHPMYVFLDVALLGVILIAGNEYLLAPWVLLVVIHVWRMRREETLLEEAFGDAYRQYRENTWF